ncbi:MAG: PAS domain S-box protein, partial [Nitrosomonas sp.]|nr:PAS domain S-box protein [Nitrosomonas sp.]
MKTDANMQLSGAASAEAIFRAQAILDSMIAQVAVLNRNGIIVAVNESWRRFPEENGTDLGKPARCTEIGANYLEISKGNQEAYEGILMVLDGRLPNFNLEYSCHSLNEQTWFIMSVTPLEMKDSGVIITHYNITERKRLEEETVTKAAWQEAVLSYTNCAIIATTPDGLIQTFNQAAEKMLGYKAEEMINKVTPSIIHDPNEVAERAKIFSEELDTTIELGFEVLIAKSRRNLRNEHEWIYIRKDGTRFFVLLAISALRNSSGAITGFLGMALDITERKRMEELLRQTTDRLALATRAGGVGIWDWDIVQNILTWDDQMFALYGITRDYFGGAYEAWKSGVFPEDMKQANAEIQAALCGEKDFDTEFRILWPNGAIRHIRALATVQRDAFGQSVRMIGTNWDITESKAPKMEIRAFNENLEELVAKRTSELTAYIEAVGKLALVSVTDCSGRILQANATFCKVSGYSE